MKRFWWSLGALILVVAAYYSLAPQPSLPSAFLWNDKLNHSLGHGLLTLYFCGLVARPRWWLIFIYLLLFGVAIEVAQHFMHAGRQADARDVLANALGCLAGLLLARLGLAQWPRWIERLLGRGAAT